MTGENVKPTTVSQNPVAEREQNWKDNWEAYRTAKPEIHKRLAWAQSSLATQIRTEKIGFADFLHRQRVLSVTSP